ncbi:sigma-70 family RNA polymerase sigma factor [Streptomyces sp. NPDC055897]
MTHITAAEISAAKNNDLNAVTRVIEETESLVVGRARSYATRSDGTDWGMVDDLAQAGRMAVWSSMAKFEGESPAQFMAYIDRALHSAMGDMRRETKQPGVSSSTAKDFELALSLAGGDPYEAARIGCTEEMGPRKMTRDRANSALVAWLGTLSLDHVVGVDESGEAVSLADVVAEQVSVPVDLLDACDYESARSLAIRSQVHRTLGALGVRQCHVLKADHGIAPVRDYGMNSTDAELAEDMGATSKQVREARSKGRKRFRELYQAGARAW